MVGVSLRDSAHANQKAEGPGRNTLAQTAEVDRGLRGTSGKGRSPREYGQPGEGDHRRESRARLNQQNALLKDLSDGPGKPKWRLRTRSRLVGRPERPRS